MPIASIKSDTGVTHYKHLYRTTGSHPSDAAQWELSSPDMDLEGQKRGGICHHCGKSHSTARVESVSPPLRKTLWLRWHRWERKSSSSDAIRRLIRRV